MPQEKMIKLTENQAKWILNHLYSFKCLLKERSKTRGMNGYPHTTKQINHIIETIYPQIQDDKKLYFSMYQEAIY